MLVRILLFLFFTGITFSGEVYDKLIKEIPKEFHYHFITVDGPNAYQLVEETLQNVDESKIAQFPEVVWNEKDKATLFLSKYKSSIEFLNKIIKMDYALPKDYEFTSNYGKLNYLRFIYRLKALQLKFGGEQEINDSLNCLEFAKKCALQSDSTVKILVLIACQKIIYDELKLKKINDASLERLKKSLIKKQDYYISLVAELYMSAAMLESVSTDESIKDFDLTDIFKKVIINAQYALKYFEGKIEKADFEKKIKEFNKQTYPFEEINKKPEAIIYFLSSIFLSDGLLRLENKVIKLE
ncbi:MAG: hypothetical protein NE327_20355 [Lentisphaeraceae bacterium]|nr:hypothetical protein [Lentisphaeraceae bacterium]